MKTIVKPLLLVSFLLVSAIYTYANFYDIKQLMYWSKPFIIPLLAVYYLLITKKIDLKFLIALGFAFCGDVFFLFSTESLSILGMSCFLLFMLVNMIGISSRIGEIKLDRFYLTTLPFILICMAIISIYFGDVGLMKLLFMIYAGVIGLYGAFSLYWFLKEKNTWVLLNLIGVLCFFLASIGKGLEMVEGPKGIYKMINMIFYITSILLICIGYANHNMKGPAEPKLKKTTNTL